MPVTGKVPFFALTAPGLEELSAREVALLPEVSITTTSYRRISAMCSGALESLLSLRTVDDVFLEIATWTDIGRPRSSLERLRHLAMQLDLHAAAASCASLRSMHTPALFSITASFVGKRNYTSEEIKVVLAHEIATRHGWIYQQDDRVADLNVRLFIEHETATVGVRLGKTALHDRWYQQVHLRGALKPSVAAALVWLAQMTPAMTVLDPCCGSGTILIEAALQGARVCGGDSDPLALDAARTNIAAARVRASVQDWDAQALPLADASIDRIICNLPWGRQVAIQEQTHAILYRRIVSEMRRVLAPSGRIVLLTNEPQEIDPLDLCCVQQLEISLFGQRPTILVLARPHTL
jgi:tRNA (guanine6-N2)-methyltransferase